MIRRLAARIEAGARELADPRPPPAAEAEVRVLFAAPGRLLVERSRRSSAPIVLGVRHGDRTGRSERVLSHGPDAVERSLAGLDPLPAAGETVILDRAVHADPSVTGLDLREVRIPGPLGELPAWRGGAGDDWAIVVHGRGTDRHETLRLMSALAAPGRTLLAPAYRGDPEAPRIPDGMARLGAAGAEGADLDAAVDYAASAGARRVVLAGLSQGGGMCLGRLRRETGSGLVRAAVLDAPVAEWRAVIRLALVRRDTSRIMARPLLRAFERMTGVAVDDLDHIAGAGQLDVPVLILHGDADGVVPVGGSRALAARRPDLVRLVEVPGAGHTEAWNADPDAYAARVGAFLDQALSR